MCRCSELTVECQEEREQHSNYKIAMRRLRAILFEKQFSTEYSKLERTRKLQASIICLVNFIRRLFTILV